MPTRLRYDLHCCISGGRAIFLDAAADRYFCLPSLQDALFQRYFAGKADPIDLQALARLGLIVDRSGSDHRCAPPAPALPISELPFEQAVLPGLAISVRAVIARWIAPRALRRRGFARTCRDIVAARAVNASQPGGNETDLATIAGALARTDIIFGRTERCLPRSLALMTLCHARALYPRLVIGVRTDPFAAHCWVQHDDQVLSDTVDAVRIFTPIMVL